MFGREPAIVLGALGEVVRAVIPMLILFSIIVWDDKQVAGVMLVVGVAIKFFEVILTRQSVVPTETANSQIAKAVSMPTGTTVKEVIAAEAREQ